MNTRVSKPTTRLLRTLGQALARHLPAAAGGDTHGVHQARVTSRRLREAVPVFATGLKGSSARKATRKIRRLTRALGSVRELDVTLLILDELAAASDVPRSAVEDVRAGVVRERDARRAVMLKRLGRVDLAKLAQRLESVEASLQNAPEEPWRKALGSRLLRRSRRLRAANDAAGHMYSPDRLHEVRIAAKKLRYGLELASDAGVRQVAPHVRAIKRLQDLLGKLHDLQVLQSHVAAAQISRDLARPGGRVALDELAAHVEAQCRHLHAKYLALCPGLSELPTVIRHAVVPRLLPSSAERPPLKMRLTVPAAAPQPRVARARRAAGESIRADRAGR